MEIIRFHDTPEGGSRFERVNVRFSDPFLDEFGNTYHLTGAIPAKDAVLVELPHGLDQSWHNAPNRQLVIVLDGTIEVETSDREMRRWEKGGAFLADDVVGKGHLTRVPSGPARLLFVRLPEDFELTVLTGQQ